MTRYSYGYGYILGPSPVPPTYLAGSFVSASCVPRGYNVHALSRASRCGAGGAHPTSVLASPLGARFAYPVAWKL